MSMARDQWIDPTRSISVSACALEFFIGSVLLPSVFYFDSVLCVLFSNCMNKARVAFRGHGTKPCTVYFALATVQRETRLYV